MSSEAPLTVLVVGAGPMGRYHGQAVNRIPSDVARLVGFVDPDPTVTATVSEQFGVPVLSSLDEALQSLKPNVAHICVPPAHHAMLARQCLEAGAHLYVEKPFTLQLSEAEEILQLAKQRGKKVAAGHQLLTDPASVKGASYLQSVGEVKHVESFFAFKPRREASGRRPRTPVEQLLDILPHPAYLLAHFLESGTGSPPVIRNLEASEAGWAQIEVDAGQATGSLYVTLEGRPVNSYVRIIGTRGTVYLDYVRGLAIPKIWQGSGLDKVVEPYYEALSMTWGSTLSLARRVLKRERSYPGLRPMFEALYSSIRSEGDSPVTPGNILFSVELVERVEERIEARTEPYQAPRRDPTVLVTGGTGFLGRHVVSSLVEFGEVPLVWGRRRPPSHEQVPGSHYEIRDLSVPEEGVIPSTVHTIVHCAAETSGSWDAHQKNSVEATRNLLDGAAAAGVERFIHVSSLGVLSLGARAPIGEDSPTESDPRARGPYVWGKLESERLISAYSSDVGLDASIVRPGPLLDPTAGPPPGRLGRSIGPGFVAIGPKRGPVPTTDVRMAGRLLAQAAGGRVRLPSVLHLLDPNVKTRGDLIADERRRREGVRVLWLPWFFVRMLSGLATVAQKALRPRKPAISLASAFAAPKYDTAKIAEVLAQAEPDGVSAIEDHPAASAAGVHHGK